MRKKVKKSDKNELRQAPIVAQKKSNCANDKWEEQLTEFNAYDGMPAIDFKLFNWKRSQLSSGCDCLN